MREVRSKQAWKKKRRGQWLIVLRLISRRIDRVLSIQIYQFKRKSDRHGALKERFLKRDLHKKSYENPYKKSKKRFNVPKILVTHRLFIMKGLLLGTLFVWWFVLFARPTFYLQHITVQGTREIPADDIRQIVEQELAHRSLVGIKHSHILFLSEKRLTDAIEKRFRIESLSFKADWQTNSLMVYVTEKNSQVVYGIGDEYYALDENGTIIRKLTSSDEVDQMKLRVPVIYDYTNPTDVGVGKEVLSASALNNIKSLYQELQKYSTFHIHSFKIRPLDQQTVTIQEKLPSSLSDDAQKQKNLDTELNNLVDSIAQAKTTQEKLQSAQDALQNLSIQQVGEKDVSSYLDVEKTYAPDPSNTFSELEVYMREGWSLKLGHELLDKDQSAENILDIFATLAKRIDLSREVQEYIDLRFPGRVYYR